MVRSNDGGGSAVAPVASLLDAAARAAGMLEAAWAAPEANGLRAEVVRGLGRSLKEELEALASSPGSDPAEGGCLTDGAARAADVANLAASSLPDLPAETAHQASAATHLAAGAAQALCAVAESAPTSLDDAPYARKDIRSARWRARFAVRQADEFAGIEG